MNFWISMSMPAEHRLVRTRTTCVIYVKKLHPAHSLLFILTWGGVWCRFLVLLSTSA